MTFTLLRPAEYRTQARLEIVPPSALPAADLVNTAVAVVAGGANPGTEPFLTEVQVLTSRPLLAEVVERLSKSGELPAGFGSDAVDRLQHMLDIEIVEGTQIVRLDAEGRPPQLLAALVNTLIDVFRGHLAADYRKSADSGGDQLREAVAVLDRKVAAKRQELDDYRSRYDIVSAERDENQLLSTAKGLGTALTEANSKLAAAEGHLRAVRNTVAAGQSLVGAKENPTVAVLEQRASELRETLGDLQQKFTPQYLDADPKVKTMRARLDNLEQQIKTTRVAAQRLTLAEAEQDAGAARAAVDRLQQQVEDNKSAVQAFTTHFEHYKSMQDDLTNLEKLHRAALDRVAKFEAHARESAPHVTVLEAAGIPRLPWRPNYARDATVDVLGAVLFGLFAVWLFEFLFRPAAAAGTDAAPPWWAMSLAGEAAARPLLTAEPARLLAPDAPQRELSESEIAALLHAAPAEGRLILALLLTGLSAEETAALSWDQVDLDAGVIRVPGEPAREVALVEPLRRLITERQAAGVPASARLFSGIAGAALSAEDIVRQVLYAAFDAGLGDPDEVTPRLLRHTYLVYLLRQGIRFADLGRLVGHLPQPELAVYMRVAPAQARIPFEQVDPVLPALRHLGEPSD